MQLTISWRKLPKTRMMSMLLLQNAREKANVAFPKQVAKKITAKQITNLIYCLAVAYKAVNKDFDRYSCTPIFSYKSEHIVTPLFQSRNPSNKHPLISKKYHSKFKYFLNQCDNLNTSPSNIKWLISLLSHEDIRDI